MLEVRSPSPIDLFSRLSDEEKIAIDLIQQGDDRLDDQLCALVPSEGRRGYLRTLAMQLPSCVGDASFDVEAAKWAAARARAEAATAKWRDERERDRAWLETLSPAVRRSVERQRRRRARRR